MSSRNLLNLYERHGFISNHYPREKGHDIAAYLEKGQRTIYAGFDPTACSLHIGNLMVICGLLHAQKAGHKTIGIIKLLMDLVSQISVLGSYSEPENEKSPGQKTCEIKLINFKEFFLIFFDFLRVKFQFLWKIFKKKFREIDLLVSPKG